MSRSISLQMLCWITTIWHAATPIKPAFLTLNNFFYTHNNKINNKWQQNDKQKLQKSANKAQKVMKKQQQCSRFWQKTKNLDPPQKSHKVWQTTVKMQETLIKIHLYEKVNKSKETTTQQNNK